MNAKQSPSEEHFLDSSTPIKSLKLSHEDHIAAYPWAHEASKNFNKRTPLAQEDEEVEFLNMSYRQLPRYLTLAQKEQMRQGITLTDAAMRKIYQNIGVKKEGTRKLFFCNICNPSIAFRTDKKPLCKRHVRSHLGYSFYRCSFCNFMCNNTNSVTVHYITRHGIPQKWTLSTKI